MEHTIGCKNDEYTDDEEMFKPRKRKVLEFKTLPWAKQMYSIERYIHTLWLDPVLEVHIETLGQMVKGHYIVNKERQVLRKLFNIQKQENGKFQCECEILTFFYSINLIWITAQ